MNSLIQTLSLTLENPHLFSKKIAELTSDVFHIFDFKTGKLIYINAKITDILGYEVEEIEQIGNLHELIKTEKRTEENNIKNTYESASDETFVTAEYCFSDKNGFDKIVTSRGLVYSRDEDGNPLEILEILTDVTKEKQATEALLNQELILEQRIKDLNHSNNDLEQFAYIASHDLQEPLRKISAFGERLQKKYEDQLGEEGNLYLNRMRDASVRMSNLINNLLTFSRTVRKNEPFVLTNLNKVVKNVLSDLEIAIAERKAEIKVADLPSLDAFPTQMSQLFLNLIGNALKFSKKDTHPIIQVRCEALSESEKDQFLLNTNMDYSKISIEDNGIGFEPEYAEKVFVIFQRLHGRSEYDGNGIGLAICKKIAENHKGLIFAEGKNNKGAIFTVILPIMKA